MTLHPRERIFTPVSFDNGAPSATNQTSQENQMKTLSLVKTLERAVANTQDARLEATVRETAELGIEPGALTPETIRPDSALAFLITAERALRKALTLAQMDLAAEKIQTRSKRSAERRVAVELEIASRDRAARANGGRS